MHNSGEIMNVRGEKENEHLAHRCSQYAEKIFMVQGTWYRFRGPYNAWLPLWVRDNSCTQLHSVEKNVLSDEQNRHRHHFIWSPGGRSDTGMFFSVLLRKEPQNLLTSKSIQTVQFLRREYKKLMVKSWGRREELNKF